jgi:hypothetical protein
MWIIMQVAPIRNEKDVTALYLLIFKDITALKQPIEEEENKGSVLIWSWMEAKGHN